MTDGLAASTTDEPKKVGIGLTIGVFVLPIVFGWFIIGRAGYSPLAKKLTIAWMVVITLGMWSAKDKGKDDTTKAPDAGATVASAEAPAIAKPAPMQAVTAQADNQGLPTDHLFLREAVADGRQFVGYDEGNPNSKQSFRISMRGNRMVFTVDGVPSEGQFRRIDYPDKECWGYDSNVVGNTVRRMVCEYTKDAVVATASGNKSRARGEWVFASQQTGDIALYVELHLEIDIPPRG